MIDNRLKKEKFRTEGKKSAGGTWKKEFANDGKGRMGENEKEKRDKDKVLRGEAFDGKARRSETPNGKAFGGKKQSVGSWSEKKQNGKAQNGNVQSGKSPYTRPTQSDKSQDGKMRNDKIRNDERPYNKARNDERPYNKARNDERPYNKARNDERPYNKARNDERPYNKARNDERPYSKARNDERPYDKARNDERPYDKVRNDERPNYKARNDERPYNKARNDERPYDKVRNDERPNYKARNDERPYNKARNDERPYARNDERPYNKARNDERPYNKARNDEKPNNKVRNDERPYNKARNDERPNNKARNDERPNNKARDDERPNNKSRNDERPNYKARNDERSNNKARDDERPNNKMRRDRGQGNTPQCPVNRSCGGCQLLHLPYKKQLEQKQNDLETLLKPFCRLESMIGMSDPYHYRNKVHAVFDHDRKGNPISGVYEANSHIVVPVESCLIEDQKSDEIIGAIRGMLKSFKIRTYDEDTGYGLLRHVLIRRGFVTGEIMVVLVTASPIFPSKNNFVKALRERHPEITTVIQNMNNRGTSMVLGDKENVLYGKGYIEDVLCGCRFRISSKSFYQVNPVQTEVLYKKAIEAAGLTGKERIIDAYCGIGTIGIVASRHVKEVIGVELNKDAVRDAIENAKINQVKNASFYCNDAGQFMANMAESGEHVDVVFMDPPRSGSTEEFIESVSKMRPGKIVYVSCGPETLARDLEYFKKKGYEAKKAWGVDMFPWTTHVETVILMTRCGKNDK
ncbi:MAG: methyltransferase, TrmA family [Lacrimispora sp.]|nr:methyltransferase, TrmA family [Lacrimispora sp.]